MSTFDISRPRMHLCSDDTETKAKAVEKLMAEKLIASLRAGRPSEDKLVELCEALQLSLAGTESLVEPSLCALRDDLTTIAAALITMSGGQTHAKSVEALQAAAKTRPAANLLHLINAAVNASGYWQEGRAFAGRLVVVTCCCC